MRTQALATSVSLALLGINAPQAADIPVDARIEAVKVYQQGATVTRRSQVNVASGSHRLIFKNLPANLDTDTLRISVGSGEVRLGGIEVERVTDTEYVSAQERVLRDRLQSLTDQRTAIQDEIATAETQLKLIDSLATAPAGGSAKPAIDATNLSAVLNTMSTASTSARARVRDAKQRQRELDKEVAKTSADLQKIATSRKQTLEVRAALESSSNAQPVVAIEYSTDDAQWRWVYEARLDTSSKKLTFARQASVSQSSGEDWQNAMLTLTTARPAEDAMTPKLGSLFVDLEEPTRVTSMARPLAAPASDLAEAVVVTGQMRRAEVVSTEYLADYRIPGRISLEADDEPRLYPVAENSVDVNLTARVIPAVSRSAYLEALFTFAEDVPMQGGQVQLFRDGAFVGVAQLDSLLPGAEARIPFGIDERIRVVVRDEPKESGKEGLLSKQRIVEHKQRIETTNYHSIPITIEILDRVPVAENRDVRIETLKGSTPPTVENLDGKSGVMLWRVVADPKQTATVRHYYSIRHPAERSLARRED